MQKKTLAMAATALLLGTAAVAAPPSRVAEDVRTPRRHLGQQAVETHSYRPSSSARTTGEVDAVEENAVVVVVVTAVAVMAGVATAAVVMAVVAMVVVAMVVAVTAVVATAVAVTAVGTVVPPRSIPARYRARSLCCVAVLYCSRIVAGGWPASASSGRCGADRPRSSCVGPPPQGGAGRWHPPSWKAWGIRPKELFPKKIWNRLLCSKILQKNAAFSEALV